MFLMRVSPGQLQSAAVIVFVSMLEKEPRKTDSLCLQIGLYLYLYAFVCVYVYVQEEDSWAGSICCCCIFVNVGALDKG